MPRVLLGLLAALLLAATCDPPPPLPPLVPPERPDAGDVADCEAACQRLAELGCEEAQPTPHGATCVEVCDNVESSGATTLVPGCVAEADSCEQARGCGYGAP